MTLEWILGMVASLFGGLNIFQFLFFRSEMKKHRAEANKAAVEAKQKSIDLQQDQYDYLLQKLTKYQQDYFELGELMKREAQKHAEEMNETVQKYLTIANQKCNEIAELKSKLTYYKGLRCYKSDCGARIMTNPKDGDSTKEAIRQTKA